MTDEQIEETRVALGACLRDTCVQVASVNLRLVYELIAEVQRHRANCRAIARISRDSDRPLIAQMAAAMAADRGCSPLGVYAADEYAKAARELLAAIDRSAP